MYHERVDRQGAGVYQLVGRAAERHEADLVLEVHPHDLVGDRHAGHRLTAPEAVRDYDVDHRVEVDRAVVHLQADLVHGHVEVRQERAPVHLEVVPEVGDVSLVLVRAADQRLDFFDEPDRFFSRDNTICHEGFFKKRTRGAEI
jgi:hypothetical protein